MNDDNDNVFRLGTVKGGKDNDEPNIPVNAYVVTDIDDNEFFGTGFMIFTSQHVAIMRDDGNGAIPVLVVPIARVKAAEIFEDEELFVEEAEVISGT